jgi:hypothetical protein
MAEHQSPWFAPTDNYRMVSYTPRKTDSRQLAALSMICAFPGRGNPRERHHKKASENYFWSLSRGLRMGQYDRSSSCHQSVRPHGVEHGYDVKDARKNDSAFRNSLLNRHFEDDGFHGKRKPSPSSDRPAVAARQRCWRGKAHGAPSSLLWASPRLRDGLGPRGPRLQIGFGPPVE